MSLELLNVNFIFFFKIFGESEFRACINKELNYIQSGGIRIDNIKFIDLPQSELRMSKKWIQDKSEFVPYTDSKVRIFMHVFNFLGSYM